MDIDRKTEQFEVRNYETVDQVSEARQTEVLYYNTILEWLLKNEEKDNKQNRSFQKEKKIYEECNERQDADNNRIFELKRRSEEKVQGFRREYAPKNKEELMRKGKEKENQHTYLGSVKTEGGLGLVIAKSLKGMPVVSTNNSTLGKDLVPHSTNLNKDQNHQGIVAQ
ncbi:40588_t:CDS:2 [Gigaspora margarita]|uniref:40588_t:CDS:1 n=1 Tax=Gigaspora margarita TaxID=4874 RepID=A0ABN7VRN0_GIGMA|nr:40588_t:CDS:2 [Gigaspora margarita]